MPEYRPGERWQSDMCGGEFVVIKAPAASGVLTCGGREVRPQGSAPVQSDSVAAPGQGVLPGKRYTDPESGLEVLCTKGSANDLAFAGRVLSRKEAKPLPASD